MKNGVKNIQAAAYNGILISIIGRSLSYGSNTCCTCFLRSFFFYNKTYIGIFCQFLVFLSYFDFNWKLLLLTRRKTKTKYAWKKFNIGGRHVMNRVQISFLAESTSSWWKCSSSFSIMGSSLISSIPFTAVKNWFTTYIKQNMFQTFYFLYPYDNKTQPFSGPPQELKL